MKTRVIRLRCTEDEFVAWNQTAKDADLTVSDFVRSLLSKANGRMTVIGTGETVVRVATTVVPVPTIDDYALDVATKRKVNRR